MNTKKSLAGILLIALLFVFTACGDNGDAGQSAVSVPSSGISETNGNSSNVAAKNIILNVVTTGGEEKTFEIATDAENLREALEQESLIAGDESEFGLFVKTVNGITADDSNQEWWCLTKGGEMWSYGVDSTEIEDGDVFEFTLTEGY